MLWLLGLGVAAFAFSKRTSDVQVDAQKQAQAQADGQAQMQQHLDSVALGQAYEWDMNRVVAEPVAFWPPMYLLQLKATSPWLSTEIDRLIGVLEPLRTDRLKVACNGGRVEACDLVASLTGATGIQGRMIARSQMLHGRWR